MALMVNGVDDGEKMDEGIMVHNGSDINYIWDGELRNWFGSFATERIVFIFDTCLAGGMDDVVDAGRVVVMSSGETQSSNVYSSGEFGEGMFSHYFVNRGMLRGLADRYNQISEKDNAVAVEEAFDYAKEKFPPYLEGRQNPIINDLFTDDLLLGYNL